MDNKKCECMIKITYGLPCGCVFAKKLRNGRPIGLDFVNNHHKGLYFDDNVVAKEGNPLVSILSGMEFRFVRTF